MSREPIRGYEIEGRRLKPTKREYIEDAVDALPDGCPPYIHTVTELVKGRDWESFYGPNADPEIKKKLRRKPFSESSNAKKSRAFRKNLTIWRRNRETGFLDEPTLPKYQKARRVRQIRKLKAESEQQRRERLDFEAQRKREDRIVEKLDSGKPFKTKMTPTEQKEAQKKANREYARRKREAKKTKTCSTMPPQ